jgi:hypothetical protein
MLPVDFLGIGSVFELDTALILRGHMKRLSYFFLTHIFEALEDGTFLVLGPAGEYKFFSDTLIACFQSELPITVSY